MTRGRRVFLDGIILFLMIGFLWLITEKEHRTDGQTLRGRFRIVDGDTLALDEERLRLKGIDAPELDQICERSGNEWPCGRDAKKSLQDLASGTNISCFGHVRDRYGRLLVTCRNGTENINATMVSKGMAVAYGSYETEERSAITGRLGLWAGRFEMPRDVRQDKRQIETWSWLGDLVPWR